MSHVARFRDKTITVFDFKLSVFQTDTMLQNPGAIIIPNNYSHLMIARNLWVMSAIEKISRNKSISNQ